MTALGNVHGATAPHAGSNVKKKNADLDNAQVGGAYMAHVQPNSVFGSSVNLTDKQKDVSVFS